MTDTACTHRMIQAVATFDKDGKPIEAHLQCTNCRARVGDGYVEMLPNAGGEDLSEEFEIPNVGTPEGRAAFRDRQLAEGAMLLPASIAALDEMICGCSGDVWDWTLRYLSVLGDPQGAPWVPNTGPEWLAVNLLDYLEWTEHGTSLRHPWLTDAGKEALAFLREHPEWMDPSSDVWWIDNEGTTRRGSMIAGACEVLVDLAAGTLRECGNETEARMVEERWGSHRW